MFLFRGYMGTILHTGDFRFHQGMITENPILYPIHLRTSDLAKCSIHVDEVIFDNTFCDPVFKFPPRVAFINLNLNFEFFLEKSPEGLDRHH